MDATTGHLGLSASRLIVPAATGSLTVATFYVRVKQRFTATALTIASRGSQRADLFARGQSFQPVLIGSVLTMGDLYRTYLPQARR